MNTPAPDSGALLTPHEIGRVVTETLVRLERENAALRAEVKRLERENGELLDDLHGANEAVRELQAMVNRNVGG